MNKLLITFIFALFCQPSFAIPIKIDFNSAFVKIVDPNGTAPVALYDLFEGYLIFDSATPDTNSTSIPDGSRTNEFGEFTGAITDIFMTFNGLEFRLDNTSPNLIKTASYAGTSINFDLEATAKIKSNDTVLDFLFGTNGDGVRGGAGIPNPIDSLPSAGDYVGDGSLIKLSSSADNYELTTDLNAIGMFYVAPVPVPAAVWLLGSGLIGLLGIARRKKV